MEAAFNTAGERLAAEFDPRLAEVWLDVFNYSAGNGSLPEEFGWFLRMAYLKGYQDALSEPVPGLLYRKLGAARPAGRRTAKIPGGRK